MHHAHAKQNNTNEVFRNFIHSTWVGTPEDKRTSSTHSAYTGKSFDSLR